MGLTADQRAETLELIELAQRRHDEHFFSNIWPQLTRSCPIGRRLAVMMAVALGIGVGAGVAGTATITRLLLLVAP